MSHLCAIFPKMTSQLDQSQDPEGKAGLFRWRTLALWRLTLRSDWFPEGQTFFANLGSMIVFQASLINLADGIAHIPAAYAFDGAATQLLSFEQLKQCLVVRQPP
jgi:hypothetical protein